MAADHPEDFYGAMGRMVCVSAVLEDQITSLRHALANAEQGRFTHQPVSEQIRIARTLTRDLPAPEADLVGAFLRDAEAAFATRNTLVHSSFPSQPSGKLWGHRPVRSKEVTDGTADCVETSVDEMRRFIGELVRLVQHFNQVFASYAQSRHAVSARHITPGSRS